MEFDKVLHSRRSIRKYKRNPVSLDQIIALLEAARLSPSGLNCQPWRFVVVTDTEVRRTIAGATGSPFVADAPAIILCCIDLATYASIGERIRELQDAGAFEEGAAEGLATCMREQPVSADANWMWQALAMNVAIAVTHIMLKATDLGLGSCWIGMFDEGQVKQAVTLDARHSVAAMVTVGYATSQPPPRPRLPVETLLLKTI